MSNRTLLTTGQQLDFTQNGAELLIRGLPKESPTALFPVIRIECVGKPEANRWGKERLWAGDPERIARWALTRGTSPYANGRPRL